MYVFLNMYGSVVHFLRAVVWQVMEEIELLLREFCNNHEAVVNLLLDVMWMNAYFKQRLFNSTITDIYTAYLPDSWFTLFTLRQVDY